MIDKEGNVLQQQHRPGHLLRKVAYSKAPFLAKKIYRLSPILDACFRRRSHVFNAPTSPTDQKGNLAYVDI